MKLLRSAEDIIALTEELGFLPFFRNGISGFSIEERTLPELWLAILTGRGNGKAPVRVPASAYTANSSAARPDM